MNCVIASGSTETSSGKVELLSGPVWVFATVVNPHFLYQVAGGGEEEEKELGQVENEDSYVCKLPEGGAVIQFENCGARSKILNYYNPRELEQDYSHLLTAEMGCTLCGKEQLPHYCGHFYKEIVQGNEDYFTDTNAASINKNIIVILEIKWDIMDSYFSLRLN